MNKNHMNLLGKHANFHHIGMVVEDIYSFAKKENVVVDKKNKVKVFFTYFHGIDMEIVEPTDENSPAYGPLKKNQRLYHLAFTTKNFKKTLIYAKKNSFIQLWQPIPAKAFDNKKIVWLYNKKIGLIELIILDGTLI